MTKGSTSIAVLEGMNETLRPKAVPELVDARTDCLVALQEGETDAYLGHDTFLVGMVEQDPDLRIVDQGEEQHYGIAMSPRATAFVQYVNGFLEQERSSGRLQALYDLRLWPLAKLALQPRAVVPPADATRPLP
jgi:ABC-type amino acid transport substrate-binding protein